MRTIDHVILVAIGLLLIAVQLARSQDLDEPGQPDWRRPFLGPGTSFTGGAMDVYRQPGIGTGYGVENGGAYTYRDRRGTATCTDTAGLITCLGSPDPDPAGFLHEPR